MPGISGLETATRIKHGTRTRDVPIIFLTAAIAQPERDAEATQLAARLAGRVDRLRDALDALGAGPGGMGGGQPSMTGGVAPRERGSQQSAGQPG
jgi:CheY-like chemotaxis protein